MTRRRRRSHSPSPQSAPGLAPSSHGHSYGGGGGGSGYDAVTSTTMRGAVLWPQLDTRKEITTFTRTEIMRLGRAMSANGGLAAHIIEGLAALIGYLTPMAATLDREWNQLSNVNFREKQSIPEVFDASGKFSFWEYQLKIDESAFQDGDILPVLTSTSSNTARIATYEAHQIMQPYGLDPADRSWRDGVKLNGFNRHLAYNLVDPDDRTKNTVIRAEDAIYYAHPRKIGHVRPVSILSAALNHLRDMGEIVRDVKYGIKVRNQIPLTLESQLGTTTFSDNATQSLVNQARTRTVPATAGDGTATTQEVNYEEVMQGGNIPRLKPGQSLKAIIDAAPHPNQLALLDWMVRDIAWSVGLPPEILWDINSLRGANNRLLNAIVQRWIGVRLLRKRNFVRRFWVYHCAKEMKEGRLRPCRDPEWWKVAMLPQASITADRGREGKLDIELVANRLMSLQTFFAKDGLDWLTEIKQMSEENDQLADLGLVVADVARGGKKKPEEEEETPPDEDDPAADDEEDDKRRQKAA